MIAAKLSKIIKAPFRGFAKISTDRDDAYSSILETSNFTRRFKEAVPLSLFPVKVNFIQKILTLCLYAKSSSTNDVS